jgi:Family of unknown function (DUF6151)
VSLKLAAIVREGASRWRLSCGTRAWAAVHAAISEGERYLSHPLQCRCGTLKGYVAHPERVNRVVCYCRDCQAFAHFLGGANDILDAQGGPT